MRFGVSHRSLVAFPLAALLYGALTAFASPVAAQTPGTGPALPSSRPAPAINIPHIALLLPFNSGAFARPAEAVKQGFLAAAKTQGHAPLPIRIYPVSEDTQQVVAGYRQALAAGARIVVGPLTRDGVTALAASDLVTVPTLALNAPDEAGPPPPGLYTLSLQTEAEARWIARLAIKDGRRSAFVISGGTSLMKRVARAFAETYTQLGGALTAEYAFSSDPADLARIKQATGSGTADMAFLALDFRQARVVCPYLDPLQLYATSQVYPGDAGALAGFDLNGIRFAGMPWLLQPDHPAVMIYPRQNYRDAVDLDRLYALGIDAFRIAQALLGGGSEITLDGVTGHLTLGRDHRFAREPVIAQFAEGKLLILATRP